MSRFGKLFVFEGVDGVGKTTLSRRFAEHVQTLGYQCDWFSFPGRENGTLGKHVYDIHHDRMGICKDSIDSSSLQMLHVAAHIDAINRRILPALRLGRIVVLDRYWWSTYVYGIIAGVDQNSLKKMIQIELGNWGRIRPHCAFFVRRKEAIGENLRFEQTSLAKEYERLASSESRKHPVVIIDNDHDVADAFKLVVLSANLDKQGFNAGLEMNCRASGSTPFHASRSTPFFFSKLEPAKPTPVYDTYWRFAAERQLVFFRKLLDDPPPWTNDTVLSEHKFTNAYRASDRTSQYLIKEVIYAGDQTFDEVFFRTILFKLFNRIDTWKLLAREFGVISHKDYSFAAYDSILTSAMNRGEKIYSGAYIMPSGQRGTRNIRKHRMHLKLLEKMMEDELPARIAQSQSMAKAFELLRAYPSIGDFLAYQYVTDLNYCATLSYSEMEFVVPGPGARDGIRKCFSDFGGLSETDIIRVVAERQSDEFDRLGLHFKSLWGRPLQLIDCQNLFCEVDKYARVKHPEFIGRTGRSRIKRKYRVTAEPLFYWYPPKWGLNEIITKGGIVVSTI